MTASVKKNDISIETKNELKDLVDDLGSTVRLTCECTERNYVLDHVIGIFKSYKSSNEMLS